MKRRPASTDNMVDQVGKTIAKPDVACFEGNPASLPKAGTGGAEAAGPTD